MTAEERAARDVVPLRTAAKVWTLVALQSFGGPAGPIAVMQRVLVDDRRWIGRGRFLHALNFCTILPGPEATQLAVYIGWLLNGARGGMLAGVLFVLPGAIALFALSAVYVAFGTTTLVTAVFGGISAAVLAIVAQAVVRVGRRALGRASLVSIAVVSFLALSLFSALTFAGLSPYVAKLISDTACFFFNFLIMRVWVYRPRDPEVGEAGQSPPPRSERHGRFAV